MKNLIFTILTLLPVCLTAQFLTTWKTDNSGTSCSSCISIPTLGSGFSYDIDWENDGVIDDFGVTGNITHDYGTAGTYQVAITGTFKRIYFNNQGDKHKILSVDQWGTYPWTSMERAFSGCSNVEVLATDVPNLSDCLRFPLIFFEATKVNGGLEDWDTSNIDNMASAFSGASSFNGDISGWDVSNVTNTAAMFKNTPFNQDISGWDVSTCLHLIQMFELNTAFNQDISSWTFPGVSPSQGIQRMFNGCTSFNQDLSAWDVSTSSNFYRMFYNCTSLDQSFAAWDMTSATTCTQMFQGVTLSVANYDATLIAWDAQNLNSNLQFHGGNSEYCVGETARTNMITNDGWTITDGGLDAMCSIVPVTWNEFKVSLLKDDSGLLEWYTSTETNNDFFEILKSTDGQFYEVIGKVQGAGNSSEINSYEFIDNRLEIGNSYYKIRQIDYDGNDSYSPVRSIRLKSNATSFIISPNPTTSNEFKISSRNVSGDVDFYLYDRLGKQVDHLTKELNQQDQFTLIPNVNLNSGLYFLRIYRGNQFIETQRITIIK